MTNATYDYDSLYQTVIACTQEPGDTPILQVVAEKMGVRYQLAGQRISRMRKMGFDLSLYDFAVASQTQSRKHQRMAKTQPVALLSALDWFYEVVTGCAAMCAQGEIVEAIALKTGASPQWISYRIAQLRERGYDVSMYDRLKYAPGLGVIGKLEARIADLEKRVATLSALIEKSA